jgi:CO/xanthine dehydrogenase Mo-binding subunit
VTSFCIQIAQVGVDVETGQVLLSEVLNALDVAEILEPISHQNQIEGGMGIGYALVLRFINDVRVMLPP